MQEYFILFMYQAGVIATDCGGKVDRPIYVCTARV